MHLNLISIFSFAALAVAVPFEAADASASKEENVGVGSGLVVGAIAGGPVGAIVGAAIGAKLGDSMHERNARIAMLDSELGDERRSVSSLEREVAVLDRRNRVLDRDLDRLRAKARPELEAMLAAGIEMDLLFRTDEHVLTDATERRFRDLAASVASMPDLKIRIDGYSDERGSEDYNRELSAKRAHHIESLLKTAGVPAERIVLEAHGESAADDPSPDSLALERRVSVTLFVGPEAQVADSGSD